MAMNCEKFSTVAEMLVVITKPTRLVMTCKIAKHGNAEDTEERTYHVFRTTVFEDGPWWIDVGDGGYIERENWDRVIGFLEKMRPTDIEVVW